MKKSCGIFTNIAPIYSRPLWYELTSSKEVDYSFYSSRSGFAGIKTIDINESVFINPDGILKWQFLKNIYFRKILLFQCGVISKCIFTGFDAYIFNGEMQCFSTWLASLICKIRRKPVLFWSHGFYGNEKGFKRVLRLLFYKMADYHMVYGQGSRDLMIKYGFPEEKIYVVYNSLDYNSHKKLYNNRDFNELNNIKKELFRTHDGLPVVIFIGRLTRQKKLPYLIEAIHKSKLKGNLYNCLIVGSGNELKTLQELSRSLGINDQICFYGPSYDESISARLIMMADCCVCPNDVGLSAIHSLSLGTPVITHRNSTNHGPEAESVIENKTGSFFIEDDVNSLSDTIDKFISEKKKSSMEKYCIEQIEKYWNPVRQAAVFNEVVLQATERNGR